MVGRIERLAQYMKSYISKMFWSFRRPTPGAARLAAIEGEMACLAPAAPIEPRVTTRFECGYDVHLSAC
jgi:hypothetical protein